MYNKLKNIFLFSNTSKVPNTVEELTKDAPLQYNLLENDKFQPLHIETNITKNTSTELIGRFTGIKQDNNKFLISKIEFKFFEITVNPRTIVVDYVEISKESTEEQIKLLVFIQDLNKDRPLNKADFTLEKDILVSKNTFIDIHIIDKNEVYPTIETMIPKGKHCGGNSNF